MSETAKIESGRRMKRMEISEFRRLGILQEVNRRLLHPMGLALVVNIDDDGNEDLAFVWDCRDDPMGIAYPDHGGIDPEKVKRVDELISSKKEERVRVLGDVIQPVGS